MVSTIQTPPKAKARPLTPRTHNTTPPSSPFLLLVKASRVLVLVPVAHYQRRRVSCLHGSATGAQGEAREGGGGGCRRRAGLPVRGGGGGGGGRRRRGGVAAAPRGVPVPVAEVPRRPRRVPRRRRRRRGLGAAGRLLPLPRRRRRRGHRRAGGPPGVAAAQQARAPRRRRRVARRRRGRRGGPGLAVRPHVPQRAGLVGGVSWDGRARALPRARAGGCEPRVASRAPRRPHHHQPHHADLARRSDVGRPERLH